MDQYQSPLEQAQLTQEERVLVQSRIDELSELVRLISMRPELRFTIGSAHSPWSFNFHNHTVSAPINDLLEESADYCRGLTLHEAAHATVTRIFDLLNPKIAQRREYHALFNVIEDCRIETWILERTPGARPWMTEYNDKLFTPILSGPLPHTLTGQYLAAILSHWWFNQYPEQLQPEVIEALEESRPSINRAIAAQPPSSIISSNIYSEIYQKHRSLTVIYLQSDRIAPPHEFECAVRLRQLQMIIEINKEVFPIYSRLIETDQKQQGKQVLEADLTQLLEGLRGDHLSTSTGHQSSSERDRDDRENQSDKESEAQRLNDELNAEHSPEKRRPLDEARPIEEMKREMQRALAIDPTDRYLRTWRQLSAEIDLLSDTLIRVIEKRVKPTWQRGCSSGVRLDLRRAMAFEADPRLYQSLWMRQVKPTKLDPAFTILIDISGSMEGENIQGAFKGLVLFTEVCARLNLPLELISFNHHAQQLKVWDRGIDESLRSRLGRLSQSVSGGTDLTAALKLTHDRIKHLSFKDRFLVTLSDGEPNDVNSVLREIKALESHGVHCIGVGIGPDTERLRRFFSDGVYEVTPMELARQLGGLLDRLLRLP